VFDAKAGASLTAQAVMVGEVNTALAWQADSMTATAGSMTAAASSAAAAASSATAAAGSVVSAQAQVGLAATQAGNAAASANSAQVAAAAAGSAAGLPSVVGHGGQALVAKKDESGFELKALDQAIGDVLITTRTPDATYLLPDTVYSRAAYPELFSIVGSTEDKNDAGNFSISSSGQGGNTYFRSVACGKDNLMIAVGFTGNNASAAIKSIDGGATWSVISSISGIDSINLRCIATDEKGVWIIGTGSGTGYRSKDNGMTWSAAFGMAGITAACSCLATTKSGAWMASAADSQSYTFSRSIDNGNTWTSIANIGLAGLITADEYGTFYTVYSNVLYKSFDNGASWYQVGYLGAGGAFPPIFNKGVGVLWAGYGIYITSDRGETWQSFSYNSASQGRYWVDRESVVYIQQYGKMYKSYDGGCTWRVSNATYYNFSPYGLLNCMAIDGNGNWVVVNQSDPTTFYRSTRLYNYDVASQFKTPPFKAPKGYKAFMKGKLQ
jgi:hypothetical protein